MTTDPLVFLDTETTGVHDARQPWEVAVIRRVGGAYSRLLFCVDISDLDLAAADPRGLEISGFHRRHPQARPRRSFFPVVHREGDAAQLVQRWLADATVVGIVPSFDTTCLTKLLSRHGLAPSWNPNLVNVVSLATDAVRRSGRVPEPDFAGLSRQCGVKPPSAAQLHTALADARWSMRWYDRLDGEQS
jgi:hypothetical protein